MATPRKLRTNTDYLVLGGGMAGIGALAEARRLDISAIGLEARPRPGGRIRTVRQRRSAAHPIELGAEFVHGAAMKRLCESLGLTLVKHPSDGAAYVDGAFLPLLPVLDVLNRFRAEAKAHLDAGKPDRSVEEFLASAIARQPELTAGVPEHLLLQLIRNDFAARVSELGLAGLVAPDVDGYAENYRIAEGFAEVPRRLAETADLRYHHAVSAVLRHRTGVEVVTNRGVYSGNVAVVALPVGVLQAGAVTFDPPLTPGKTAALAAINAGAATKLVLSFRHTRQGATFWPNHIPLLATALATQLWWPTGWGYPEQRHFLASCLVGGAGVVRFAEGDPRRVGLVQLAHMFGRDRVERTALAPYFVKSWHDDPHTRGGYSSLPVGVDTAAVLHELQATEDETSPQLVFAGDYVTHHPGSTHSAYESGQAAVQRAALARRTRT